MNSARTSKTPVTPALLSLPDAAVYLGVPLAVVYDLAALKKIRLVKRGRRTQAVRSSLDNYVDDLPEAKINLSKRGAERLAKARAQAEGMLEGDAAA
jgi:hypothetical protein